MKSEQLYKPHDKFFTINDNDIDMDPVSIRLPTPPSLKKITGYGKHPTEQFFEYETYPPRLKRLEERTRAQVMKIFEKKRDQVFTEQKFVVAMWEILERNKEEYENEIEWMKSQVYFALKGKWYFINGKPTYLTNAHWFLLNYWYSPDCPTPKFEYRDRDRRIYLYAQYIWTTDQDETGKHTRSRTFYGILYPKHRRDGATHKFLDAGYLDTIYRVGAHFGMQSFDEANSETHYKNKLLLAWQIMPFFFKPIWKGSSSPVSGMQFLSTPLIDCPTMNSKITFANSAGRKFYEGDYLTYLQVEEAGKTILEDVAERWDVQKQCLGRADGAVIIGKTVFPSTVYEIEGSGGKAYKVLCDQSKFYERIPGKKQTLSGLAVLFIPAYDGLEGYIGPYGESVMDDPTPEQARHIRRDLGAKEHIGAENEVLLRLGDSDSIAKYYERKRLYPCSLSDCFISSEMGTDFNLKILSDRKAELARMRPSPTIRGNFYWLPHGGVPMSSEEILKRGVNIATMTGRVVFEVEEATGRWELSGTDFITNHRIRIGEYWAPGNPKYTLGCDPFKFSVKAVKASKRLGRSKGGIALFENRDLGVDPSDRDIREWETHKLVGYYKYRASSDEEYALDCLLAAIASGAMVFPETNITIVLEKFINWKHNGFLQFARDPVTGKIKETPGLSTQTKSKEQIMQVLNRYVEFRGHREVFASFINDCITINNSDELKHYDGLVAVGLALIGSESSSNLTPTDPESEKFDLGRAFKKRRYF